jgi:hypothetical protein
MNIIRSLLADLLRSSSQPEQQFTCVSGRIRSVSAISGFSSQDTVFFVLSASLSGQNWPRKLYFVPEAHRNRNRFKSFKAFNRCAPFKSLKKQNADRETSNSENSQNAEVHRIRF